MKIDNESLQKARTSQTQNIISMTSYNRNSSCLKKYLLIKDSFTFNFILPYSVLLRSTTHYRDISCIVKCKSIDCMTKCIHDDLTKACSKCLIQSTLARTSFLMDNAK